MPVKKFNGGGRRSHDRAVLAVTITVVVVAGLFFMLRSLAAVNRIALEPEVGSLRNVQIIADAAASGGKAVNFKQTSAGHDKPPADGYFQLKPVGSFEALPDDAKAANMINRSSWEPRPANKTANNTIPRQPVIRPGYGGMENAEALFGRVTGNFTGTTDEIIQWAAVKWGLPDNVIRAEMISESNWYQNEKAGGVPVRNHGYGDYGHCGGSPKESGYGTDGPASFGISQIKYCAHPNTWPNSENSTAYNLDYYGAIVRGCYEGWDSWLGNGYAAGDLWGCVGRWYAGEWYSSGAVNYINGVKNHLNAKPWLGW